MKRKRPDPAIWAAYEEARRKAYVRSVGRCDVCGLRLPPEAFHAHHRLSRAPRRIDCPCNLLVLCRRCHNDVHCGPAASREAGWIVSKHDVRPPSEVPFRTRSGMRLLLGHQGELTAAPPES